MTLADMQMEGAEAGEGPLVAGSKVVASDNRQPQIHVLELPPAKNDKVGAPGTNLRPLLHFHKMIHVRSWEALPLEAMLHVMNVLTSSGLASSAHSQLVVISLRWTCLLSGWLRPWTKLRKSSGQKVLPRDFIRD